MPGNPPPVVPPEGRFTSTATKPAVTLEATTPKPNDSNIESAITQSEGKEGVKGKRRKRAIVGELVDAGTDIDDKFLPFEPVIPPGLTETTIG